MLIIINCLSGKFVNHKGRNRHFTNPEELEEQRRAEEEKRRWRVRLFKQHEHCQYVVNEMKKKHTNISVLFLC